MIERCDLDIPADLLPLSAVSPVEDRRGLLSTGHGHEAGHR
ncbi:hypothetical protein [Microbispora sp. ATCC PTA-5024]|nr:hypothetical protein [Microbispora sp. ATCC PTA-5024]ETK36847.1 hypothetical protein MPTA5024_06550 [Microbispora sp. ATCC PTA-5024]